ncbi:DUF4129 domain-containing protein [Thermofilum pendens]|uniref:Protein-glutamine gamma-glutamyltransferase-like C-terminal domain-containing protein n=1 Tax=Thermofilum pendens (strain DSM 2475 / Hrk 5) TaxID=368408 RepID=A1RWJ2_THEPD|nr:DUF4129 domain-containing protein [Thermofilum pendens]ABL77572.1 hypothetical protein Tpen_0162 [Thermofilum pendens Hrk 5]
MRAVYVALAAAYVVAALVVASYGVTGYSFPSMNMENVFTWIAVVFLVLLGYEVARNRREILEIILEIFRRRPARDKDYTPRISTLGLIFLAMLPVLLAVILERNREERGLMNIGTGVQSNISEPVSALPGNLTAPLASSTGTSVGGSLVGVFAPLPLVLLGFAVLVALSLLLAYREALGERKEALGAPQILVKEELKASLTRIEDYPEGDVRLEIVRLYNSLCNAVNEKGARLEKSWTAREIMRFLSDTMPFIPARPLEKLTELFELALYSRRPLTERDRENAVRSLREILSAIDSAER